MDYDQLSTWDFWGLEEQVRVILEEKGYGLINFDLTYNNQNKLAPCIEVSTKLAEVLANEIREYGFKVTVKQNENRPLFSFVFMEDHYPVELLEVMV